MRECVNQVMNKEMKRQQQGITSRAVGSLPQITQSVVGVLDEIIVDNADQLYFIRPVLVSYHD